MDHVLVHLVGEGPRLLIDAGYEERVGETLAWLGREATGGPELLLLTHHHYDHLGGAEAIFAASGAVVRAHPAEIALMAERAPKLRPLPLEDGEKVRVGAIELETVLTPGHSPGHLGFWWADRRVLFGGDNVLGPITTWVGPPHGNLRRYLASLERMRSLAPEIVYTGHGPPVRKPAARIAEILRHRAQREAQVLEAIARGLDTPRRMAARIYEGLGDRQIEMGATMIGAHLEKLIEEGRVRQEDDRFMMAE